MDAKKIQRLRGTLKGLRLKAHNIKPRELVDLARKIGRVKSSRGKEPTYVYPDSSLGLYPLSIPEHPGTLKIGTACSILNHLENDLDVLEALL